MAAQASVAPAAALSFPALLRELEQEIPPEKQLILQQIGARFKETPADRASVRQGPPATEASSVCVCACGLCPVRPEWRRESSSDPPDRNPRASHQPIPSHREALPTVPRSKRVRE